MYLNDFQDLFNPLLDSFLEEKIKQTAHYQIDTITEDLLQYITHYAHGGKRVRPYLVHLGYRAFGGEDDDLPLQIGLAHELVHLFALIHDDIADQGLIRHSIPTYHKHAEQLYKSRQIGESQAMLTGDLIYTRAIEHFLATTNNAQARAYFFTMLREVIWGEVVDVHLSNIPKLVSAEQIQQKDIIKSGNYTVTRPLCIGATLAGESDITTLKSLGQQLGLAYQMRDDLMDITGAHHDKTTFSDLQEGNQTYLLHRVLEHASEKQKQTILDHLGHELSDEIRAELLTIYTETGAIDWARSAINEILDHAQQAFPRILGADNPQLIYVDQLLTLLRS